MAEYMDIARIDDWNDLSIIDDEGYATYVYDVGELPTADVIERDKIDRAIEEITELINHSKLPTVNTYNRYSEGLKDCLDILKRNIGE